MSVGNIFDIGRSGLSAMRQALQTSSNNIANASTPGYTRQRPVVEARAQNLINGAIVGGGVDIPKVIRVHDAFIDKQLQNESRVLGDARARATGLKHVENVLHTNGFEMSELMNKFFNSYRELSLNPESPASKTMVRDSASQMVRGFHQTADSLNEIKASLDLRIENVCNEVNSLTSELAGLNRRIAELEPTGQAPNELHDRRDAILREISSKLGYDSVTDASHQTSLTGSGLGSLIVGGESHKLMVVRTPADGDKTDGSVDVYLKDNFGLHRVTQTFKEGEIAGMLHVRDRVVNPVLKHLDTLAFKLGEETNRIHSQGYGSEGANPLFAMPDEVQGFASRLDLSDEVKRSEANIATGLVDGAPGDNRVALEMSGLQERALMPTPTNGSFEGEAHHTFNESLNSLMGSVATQTAAEDTRVRHQETVTNQLENYRQAISGVSLEEEAVQIMQFQATFNAAAKTMKIGDELLQTILSIKN